MPYIAQIGLYNPEDLFSSWNGYFENQHDMCIKLVIFKTRKIMLIPVP